MLEIRNMAAVDGSKASPQAHWEGLSRGRLLLQPGRPLETILLGSPKDDPTTSYTLDYVTY